VAAHDQAPSDRGQRILAVDLPVDPSNWVVVRCCSILHWDRNTRHHSRIHMPPLSHSEVVVVARPIPHLLRRLAHGKEVSQQAGLWVLIAETHSESFHLPWRGFVVFVVVVLTPCLALVRRLTWHLCLLPLLPVEQRVRQWLGLPVGRVVETVVGQAAGRRAVSGSVDHKAYYMCMHAHAREKVWSVR
jgi:hypothetical protein